MSGPYKPGEIGQMVEFVFGGDGHEIESARFVRVSPGLEVLGPVAYERERSGGYTDVKRWPPRGTRPFDGSVLDRRVNIGFGTRATKPGFYHLAGVRYRYRKGLRRFDEVDDARICIQIADPPVNQCNLDTDVAAFDGLAEIGGPSDYMAGRFPESDGFGAEHVVFRMRPRGTLEFVVTISNLSDEDRVVPRLDLGRGGDRSFRDQLDPLPPDPPAPFTIPAGGSRRSASAPATPSALATRTPSGRRSRRSRPATTTSS